jgi:hypothetical protein
MFSQDPAKLSGVWDMSKRGNGVEAGAVAAAAPVMWRLRRLAVSTPALRPDRDWPRHADISVNGGAPQRVLFPPSFHANNFWDLTVLVQLKGGANSITFSSEELPDFDGTTYISARYPDDILRSKWAPVIDKISIAPFVADETAPTTSISVSPSAPTGSNGWYDKAVDVTVNAADASGVKTVQYSLDNGNTWVDYTGTIHLPEGVTTVQARAVDPYDNVGTATSVTVHQDSVAPTAALVGGPTGTVLFGTVPAAPSCDATDATSGLASCVVSGYSTALGSHTLTATATDNASLVTTVTRDYIVAPYTLVGFYQPVDMNVVNTAKAGSTIPVIFEIFRGQTELTDVSEVTSITYTAVTDDSSAPTDEIETLATGGTGLRYDTSSGRFIYNWKSPATGSYRLKLTTRDGSTLTALFRLR